VWNDYRNGNWDVVVNSLGGTEVFLATNDAAQADPAIHGNIIVWADNRLGTFAIYGSSFGVATAGVGNVTINEVLADPPTGTDVNGDGVADTEDDEFVELTNVTASALDISGFTLSDTTSTRHVFPAGTVIPAGGALVVFAAGAPAGYFGGVTVQVASTGALGLNNAGDTVTLRNSSGTTIDTVTFGSAAGNDASMVRVPEYTGTLTRHDLDAASGGRRFSPGTIRDGFAF
jgi:beta propeller repeat protein